MADLDVSSAPAPRGWRLARLAGVPILVRGSALVLLGVLWGVLHLQLAPVLVWREWWLAPLVTTVTCVAFLVSVVAHELAHAVVARALGIPVVSVTVFHLGGVTRLGREPDDPREEALIAAAGPLVSLLLGGTLLVAGLGLGTHTLAGGTLVFVAYLNGTLGVFNLLPGHPLDGGALVRAATWAATGDAMRALRLSGVLGQAIGAALVVGGVVGALPMGGTPGDPAWLWLAAVGGFVAVTARIGVLHAGVRAHLEGVRAGDLCRRAPFDLPVDATLGAAGPTVSRAAATGLVVDGDGAPLGVFGPDDLAAAPRGSWDRTTVGELMRPVVGVVDAGEDLLAVMARFRRTRESILAVVVEGRAVATLAASDVVTHLEAR